MGTSTTVMALTVRAPWAQLIASGHKQIENRGWATAFRGLLVIHAGRTWEPAGVETALLNGVPAPRPQDCQAGFIAVATLRGMHRAGDCGPDTVVQCQAWGMPGQWHWQLADVVRFPEVDPEPGRQGLFLPPARVRDLARRLVPTRPATNDREVRAGGHP